MITAPTSKTSVGSPSSSMLVIALVAALLVSTGLLVYLVAT